MEVVEPLVLELEQAQSQMAQKPMLRGELGAHARRVLVRGQTREKVWLNAGV